MPDHLYDRYLKGPDFINRYIFPGGCCPALKALASACSTTDLRLIHLEELSQHYVRTLQEWRSVFHLNLQEVRRQGFPERFIRMWNYYLCYCEGGFAERYTGLLQLLYARPDFRMGPLPGEAEQETG
jgi:cyclopropane-fatty-acyl-phospholipid synthase